MEWAKVYGNWYGVPKEDIKNALDRRHDAIVKVDVQGAATLKKLLPEAVFIFLIAPTMGELVSRLRQRKTESPVDLALRMKVASEEMKQLHLFDYVVVNKPDAIDEALSDVKAIMTAEKCRVTPRKISLP